MPTLRRAGDGYRIVRGVNYPNPNKRGQEKRAEPGDVVTDLPPNSIEELIRIGAIEPADMSEPTPRARARKPKPAPLEPPAAIPSGGLPQEGR